MDMRKKNIRPYFNFLLVFALLLAGATTVLAQSDSIQKPPKPRKLKKEVKRQLKVSNYYDATDLLEQYMNLKPEDVKRAYQLAQTYRTARDYKSAEKWFQFVYETDPEGYPEALYYYAEMAKMNGKYDKAAGLFEAFYKKYKGSASYLKKWARVDLEGCELANKLIAEPLQVNIFHLDTMVNSPYTDVSPMLWNDSTLLYASLPSDTIIRVHNNETDKIPYINFYTAEITDTGMRKAQLFDMFNTAGYHTANGCFNKDKTSFYFTRCEENSKHQIICALFVSDFKDGKWQEPANLGPLVNSQDYTTTHPAVALDKHDKDIIYFSSNRTGGRGGMDIWYTIRKSETSYTAPRNAGYKINTDRDEVTPYYNFARDSFYFSSNGHPGMGGFDIFATTGYMSRWTEPVNVGYPINGPTDDMYYRFNGAKKDGYFVSNRPGIISVKSETCCDDIFSFSAYTRRVVAVMGYVYDEADTTTPLNNAVVTLYNANDEQMLALRVDTAQSNKRYFFELNFDQHYKVKGDVEGYLSGSATFNTLNIPGSDTLNVNIYLKRYEVNKAYALRNIYYDYDKWFLRDTAISTLDTLYQIMIDNPTIIVELGSHTDTRATEKYNMVLSQKRAESAMQYLLKKGIPQARLVARGYGETQLLEDCSKYPDCPEEGAGDCPCHQKNRRTEFKIIGELDAPLDYEDIRYNDLDKKPDNNGG